MISYDTVMSSVLFPSMLILVISDTADALPHFMVAVKVALPPAAFEG